MIVATSSARREERAASRSSSETSAPAARSSSRPPASMHQTFSIEGTSPRIDSTSSAWRRDSTIAKRAPASPTIHWIWEGEDVSYTGTEVPPANQIAQSTRVHS